MFMDDRTTAQIAPSGSFFRQRHLHCGNAFLSEQQFQALCGQYGLTQEDTQNVYIGRRSVESGNRKDYLHHTSYRGVFGLRGEIADVWRYNLSYQYAEVRALSKSVNDLSASRINRVPGCGLRSRERRHRLPLGAERCRPELCGLEHLRGRRGH